METTYTTKAVQEAMQDIEQMGKAIEDERALIVDESGIRSASYELIASYISGMLRGSFIGYLITNETLYANCVKEKARYLEQKREYFVSNEMLNYLQKIADVKMGDDDA